MTSPPRAIRISNNRVTPYLALILAAFLFGATFVVIKGALDDLPPLAFVGWRFLIAAAALVLLGRPKGLLIWKDGFVTGLVLYAAFALQTAGLTTTTASKSGLITGLYVVITPLIVGAVRRSAPRWVTGAGAVMSVIGLGLLTAPGVDEAFVFGDALTVGAAVAIAAHIVLVDQTAGRHPVVAYTAAQMAVVAGLALLTSAMFEGLPIPTQSDLPALLLTGLFVSGGAFLIQIWAQTKISPDHTAFVLTLEPVFAVLMGVAIRDEQLSSNGWLGASVMVGAIYFVLLASVRQDRSLLD